MPVDNQTLLNQLKWRYATKKFDASRKILAADWHTLEQALILTPSSYGLEPWHFIVITSQKVKDELVHAAHGQQQVSHASHVVVLTVNKRVNAGYVEQFARRVSSARNVPLERLDGYKHIIQSNLANQDSAATEAWCARQVYIAMGNLLTCAAMLGIDACPMEGIAPAKFDQILGLEERGLGTLAIVTLGYRSHEDTAAHHAKVRFNAADVVTHIE